MKYILRFSETFLDELDNLSDKDRGIVLKKMEILRNNPKHPSLRTKKLEGHHELFESSVNMDIRLIWRYENNTIILMLDVGHHDMLKKY
jgi:mRNA interferase RelE/StbE